jgi:hypothetical protein
MSPFYKVFMAFRDYSRLTLRPLRPPPTSAGLVHVTRVAASDRVLSLPARSSPRTKLSFPLTFTLPLVLIVRPTLS